MSFNFNRLNPFKLSKKNNWFYNWFGSSYPKWLNFNTNYDILKAINTIPEAYLIINFMSSAFSNGIWRLYDKNKEEIFEHDILNKLNKPNPLQGGKEWLKQAYAYWKAFGNEFLFTPIPDSFKSVDFDSIISLWNLPAQHIKITPTGKLWHQTKIEDIIANYVFSNPNGGETPFPSTHVMHKNDLQLNFDNANYLSGESRFVSLKKPLSNLAGTYEAKNVLINKHGAIGILSNSTNGDFAQPLNPDEKTHIEEKLTNNYGLKEEQAQIIVTNSSLNYQRMSMDVRELELNRELDKDFIVICNAFYVPYEIFGSERGQVKFENKDKAEKQFYQNTIISDADDFSLELTNHLKLNEEELSLQLDYSHLPILQQDQKTKSEVAKNRIDTILNIKKSITEGNTTIDQAVALLVNEMKYTEEVALTILGG